ncbi:MAG: Ig-like domain-containing protein [Chloroflexaceae bacterium]|nr:Ig-like domain-containing protein [Chloroflexaceae bacterium]
MSYHYRITLFSLFLWCLIAVLIWWGPSVRAVVIVTQSPTGDMVSVGAPIRIIFSQPVDQSSVEARFTLTPETAGRFIWEGQTLTFQPEPALEPATTYQVTLQPGIADQTLQSTTASATGWTFRTRSPRLLLLQQTPGGAGVLWLADTTGDERRELLREQLVSRIWQWHQMETRRSSPYHVPPNAAHCSC